MKDNWKPWLFVIGAGAILLYLLFKIRYAAGGLLRVPKEIAERTYRTADEQAALFLLCFVLFLLFAALLSGALALGALCRVPAPVRFLLTAGMVFLFFLYACLYGYPLLDNHITTAWLMTGRYTETLILSFLRLLAGLFGKGFSWNESLAWRLTSGLLLTCPLILASSFVGLRNTVPVFLGAMIPVFCFFTGQLFLFPGIPMVILGAAAGLLSAVILEKCTDTRLLGRETAKGPSKVLWHVAVDDKRRAYFLSALGILWILTFLLGRVRSFGGIMKLVLSSSIYSYQKNLDALRDTGIAQALIISYVLSLCVRFVLSRIKFEDDSRFSGIISTLYMLLLQVWVLPVLSVLLNRAADHAQGILPGDTVKKTAGQLSLAASDYLAGLGGRSMVPVLIFYALAAGICLVSALLLLRIPAVRLFIWFIVYFSACTFIYCLIGLYYRKPLGTYELLLICYALTRMLNHLLSSGKRIRAWINPPESEAG